MNNIFFHGKKKIKNKKICINISLYLFLKIFYYYRAPRNSSTILGKKRKEEKDRSIKTF